MAIVLALLIIGWLVAFAVGAQAGFENSPEPMKPALETLQPTLSDYSNPAAVAEISKA